MKPLCLEYGYTSLNHVGEELCGDKVEYTRNGEYTTLVLADGLGSGVKANILATLTSKILCTMVANDICIEDCVETILQSLPVCKVRGVAYATFSIIHLNDKGEGYLIEFDNPQAVWMHNGKCRDYERTELIVLNKKVYKTELNLQSGDAIIVMSDGVMHAGVGMTLNFGWQRKEVMEHLDRFVKPDMTASCIACLLAAACNDLYMGAPGDDTTVAAVRIREVCPVNIMVGPPVDKTKDGYYVSKFLEGDCKKVVCGGTSSQIVAKYLGTEVIAEFEFPDKDVPPIGHIKGIDLVTEGVITLRKLREYSEKYLSSGDLSPKYYTGRDGASLLAQMLFERATHITFFVGQSINVAHQGLPIDNTMKLKLVDAISRNLQLMGKTVEVNYD